MLGIRKVVSSYGYGFSSVRDGFRDRVYGCYAMVSGYSLWFMVYVMVFRRYGVMKMQRFLGKWVL